jgi:hypothetical protein
MPALGAFTKVMAVITSVALGQTGDHAAEWPVPGCSSCPPFEPATNRTTGRSVEVFNPVDLPATARLRTAARSAFGIRDDYKPGLAVLGNGDLLVATRHGNTGAGGQKRFHAIIHRSTTGGDTWTRDDSFVHLYGAEFHLHCLASGTVLLVAGGGPDGGRIFRSVDNAASFQLVQDWPAARSNYSAHELGWSIVEVSAAAATATGATLPSGIYAFPGNRIWRSVDDGEHFAHHVSAAVEGGWADVDTFFGQSATPFLGAGGVLWHVTRVGVDAHWDETDGAQLWSSTSGGRTWQCETQAAGGWCRHHPCTMIRKPHANDPPVVRTPHAQCGRSDRGFGHPGTMYPHMLRLADGRVLLTFTQRCNGASGYGYGTLGPPSASNAPACAKVPDGYGTGLRGLIAADGSSFDFSKDVIIINAQDDSFDVFPAGGCGCGFGRTVQLADGSLVSVYSKMNATEVNANSAAAAGCQNDCPSLFSSHLEVVRWQLPSKHDDDNAPAVFAAAGQFQSAGTTEDAINTGWHGFATWDNPLQKMKSDDEHSSANRQRANDGYDQPNEALWKSSDDTEATAPLSKNASHGSKIDHGRLLVDGSPFFILGAYTNDLEEVDWDWLQDSGYNTVLSYTNGVRETDLIPYNFSAPANSDFRPIRCSQPATLNS